MILEPDDEGQLSYTGLVFSPDGGRIYMSNVDGSIKVFTRRRGRHRRPVAHDPPAPGRRAAAATRRSRPGWPSRPTGGGSTSAATCPTACSSSTRRRARSCGRSTSASRPSTSSSPRGKAYVSNWGGRRPEARRPHRPGRPGHRGQGRSRSGTSPARARSASSTSPRAPIEAEILVQLHASALAVSPDGRYVVCANAASDNLSVIDTTTDAVVETIWAKASPADLFGASPNALAFSPRRQDALRRQRHPERRRRHRLQPRASASPGSWGSSPSAGSRARSPSTPGRKTLCVANIKGHAVETEHLRADRRPGLQLPPVPRLGLARSPCRGRRSCWDLTAVVYDQLPPRADRPGPAQAPARPAGPARPRADRRAERLQARRLHHQGEPDLRPGPRRRRRRATAIRPSASSART